MPSLLVLIPFSSILILNLPFKKLVKKIGLELVGVLAIFQIIVAAAHPLAFWDFRYDYFARFFAFGFIADNLTRITLLSIGIVLLISLLVGRATLSDEKQRANFANLLILALLGMNITVLTSDIFSTYVFIEVIALSSFILVAMTKDQFAIEGAFKYIILSSIASVMMLLSIGILILFAGGASFENITLAFGNLQTSPLLKIGLGLFLCGLFIKSGIVPFHGWLPDVYSASSPAVSIFLAGIVTKVSGVYVLLRLMVSVFGGIAIIGKTLMFMGTLSIITGAVLALTQNNFKRLLAYSSISQVGYIILAAGCATPLAILGAAFHFFNHAIFKSLLFTNAASIEKETGTLEMDKLGGLAQKMPITGTTSIIAFLSASGIPPLAGFWSKLIIIIALWKAGNIAYSVIAMLASIITLQYFLYLQRLVFFGKTPDNNIKIREAGWDLLLPQIILAAIIVIVGICAPWMLTWR